MHIDPFAPGDSPQHPANFGKDNDLARRTLQLAEETLREEHTTAAERIAGRTPDLAELTHRSTLVAEWREDPSSIPALEDLTGATHLWGPLDPADPELQGWVQQSKPEGDDTPPDTAAELAAALAALDARK